MSFLTTILLWSLLGWVLGVAVFLVGGLFTLPLDPEIRNRVANYYSQIAMKLLGRAVLVEAGTKYDIHRTTHDPEVNQDKITIEGKTGHIGNEAGLLSTLNKKPFGLLPPRSEDVAVYLSPEIAELGEIESERQENGEVFEDGEYVEDVTLSPVRPLVKLRDYAERMVPGSRGIWDLTETEDYIEKSQALFGESKTVQFMILLIAYGGAMLLTWLILTNAGGTVPDTGVPVPDLGMLYPGVAW